MPACSRMPTWRTPCCLLPPLSITAAPSFTYLPARSNYRPFADAPCCVRCQQSSPSWPSIACHGRAISSALFVCDLPQPVLPSRLIFHQSSVVTCRVPVAPLSVNVTRAATTCAWTPTVSAVGAATWAEADGRWRTNVTAYISRAGGGWR